MAINKGALEKAFFDRFFSGYHTKKPVTEPEFPSPAKIFKALF